MVAFLSGCLPIKLAEGIRPGKSGGFYHYKITAKGGSGKYTFSISSGALPSGLSLSTDGRIKGTVSSAPGIYNFSVRAVDNIYNASSYHDEKTYSLSIDDSPYKWTIIAHFAVDNNIDYNFEKNAKIVSDYLETLEAIKAADSSNVLQIMVMMDAYNANTNFCDGYYYLSGADFASDKVVSLAEINSGLIDDSKAFLDWAAGVYPSEKYIYSIFNHGGGFDDSSKDGLLLSIGIDETDKDSLTHYEVGVLCDYLKSITGNNISIFYPFACLMGGVELAYELSGSVDYMLFSEELFPAATFSYQGMESIVDNPDITAESLGKTVCDMAYQNLSSLRADFTISLIDLSYINSLYDAIDAYALSAIDDMGVNPANAAFYNNAADKSFSMMQESSYLYDDFYYIDLGNYLNNVNDDPGIPIEVKLLANDASSIYSDAVVYSKNYGYPGTTGMTIFHNIWDSSHFYSTSLYREILEFGANSWQEYMEMLTQLNP